MRNASLFALLVLMPVLAAAEESACRRETDGRVSCDAAGFTKLTDAIITARTDAKFCAESLDDRDKRLKECAASLTVCRSEPVPAPVAAPVEPRPVLRQLSGLGLGIVATAAAVMAFAMPVDGAIRATVAGAAATAIAGSALLVAW